MKTEANMRSYIAADVRFGSKADICSATRHVRFTPKSGHKALPESGVGDLGRASLGPCGFAGAGVR